MHSCRPPNRSSSASFWPSASPSTSDKDQRPFYCVHGDCSFCDTCWDKQPAHKPNKRGTDGHAHERIDRLVVERYRNILEPSSSTQEQESLHKDDEDTTWFGIGRNRADDTPVSTNVHLYANSHTISIDTPVLYVEPSWIPDLWGTYVSLLSKR